MGSGVCLGAAVVAIAACSDAAAPLVTAKPGVVFTYPSDAQLDVPLGAPIVVTFSEPVVASALGACSGTASAPVGALCLVGPDGPISATAEVIGDGSTVQLTGAAFAPATRYELHVGSALAPTASNLPVTGPLVRFTTRSAQARAAAPALIAINGAAPAAPETERAMFESSTIRLVFSEPLDPRTAVLAPGAIELVDMVSGAAVPATVLAAGIHVAIDPTHDLVAGRSYLVKLGSLITDPSGQAVQPSSIVVTPQHSAADPPISQPLRTRQTSDPGSAKSYAGMDRNAIAIAHPLIGPVTAAMLPSAVAAELSDPRALDGPIAFTIRRGQRLRASGLDLKLGGAVPAGLSTGDIAIELLTDGGGRIYRNPHQPASQRPENGRAPLAIDLGLDLAISALDPTGNAVLSQTVLGVHGSGVVIADGGVLDIQVVLALDLDLLGVASAPTNLVLELITDPSAALEADRSAPMLVASLPALDSELAIDAGVELIFSEPIDLDRARSGIRLETSGGQSVASAIESHGAAIVLRPLAPLAYSTTYRVVLSDVADIAGNQMAASEPLSVVTPPLVATAAPLGIAALHPGAPCALTGGGATSPGRCTSGGATDDLYQPFALAANEPVEVAFTQPPLAGSISHGASCNTGSMRVERLDAAGSCVAPVLGTWYQHDRVARFVPESGWQVGARYRLTLVSGGDRICDPGEICGISGDAASFDPLAGSTSAAAGGPDLVVDFVGAPASSATLVTTQAAPFSDVNGSGMIETDEQVRDANRVALKITGTSGVITSASFQAADCVPETPGPEACMYVSGILPVELLPVAHDCPVPGGAPVASCVPVALSPQLLRATSLLLNATAVINASTITLQTPTNMLALRIREPAHGPATGYVIDDQGTPTLVIALQIYLDAPDMALPLLEHDLHSKPLSLVLRGPLRFLPDGQIAITVGNVDDVPIDVHVSAPGIAGAVNMVIPRGEMKLRLVSPPLRGGLP
jgi:hypothetical protein